MDQDHGEQVPGPEERAVSVKREEGHHPMEVTLPRNGTQAAATPLIFHVVLAGVDFLEVAEGVVPSGEPEGMVGVKRFLINRY